MAAHQQPGAGHQFPDVIPWLTGTPGPVPALDGSVNEESTGRRGDGENFGGVNRSTATGAESESGGSVAGRRPGEQQGPPRLPASLLPSTGKRRLPIVAQSAAPVVSATAPAIAVPGPVVAKPPAKPKKKRPGSGIPARKIITNLVWLRRVSQIGFFALFFYFLVQTAFRGTFSAQSGTPVRLPLPVEAFLLADPFVAAMTLLSTHTIYRGLAWSLAIVALTLVFGRVFCGWICPFGTLHHFFAWIFPSRYGKGSSRV
ncbi:MAG TPA: 4Fe-4S binding protein, partial [Polyangiaceae bacterium]|nr:4Fe-4S binding protein [Polyangiaceae bacterium]